MIAGTDNTKKGYVRQRTLCMSVNDVSRIKTWGAAKYGWTDVVFTCNPSDYGFSKQNDFSVQNCVCDGDNFMVNGSAEQKMFSTTGMYIVIGLACACGALAILAVLIYMRRAAAPIMYARPQVPMMVVNESAHMNRGYASKRHVKKSDPVEENSGDEEETRGGESNGAVKLKM